jgi:hypothetical protein
MAEQLKDSFGPDIPELIAEMLHDVEPDFDVESFLADCLLGFDDLGLTARARHVSDQLAEHL